VSLRGYKRRLSSATRIESRGAEKKRKNEFGIFDLQRKLMEMALPRAWRGIFSFQNPIKRIKTKS